MRLVFTVLILFIFTACSTTQKDYSTFFQTQSASIMKSNYVSSINLLLKLQQKLNTRNPNSYNHEKNQEMTSLIKNLSNNVFLTFKNQKVTDYKIYLNLAFSKENIKNRNDFLILGIYYLIYQSYEINKGHKLTSYFYNIDKLKKLHHNLQVIKWKIKSAKKLDGSYMFLTWQNNWQIELAKKLKKNNNIKLIALENLEYIKNKKESFLSSSNFSFEVILTQMIDRSNNSLKILDVDVTDVGFDALKSIFIFL
ncbi:MAG: hypothetical protein HRT41_09035 [Campylobacteraceae bacterium]|nr:hypothetical protein [Campylobacteraceae bacterium]